MAEEEEYRSPTVTAAELDLQKVQVILLVDGLKKKTFKNEAKNAAVDVKFHESSFEMTAEVTGSGGKITKYKHVVKALPGPIKDSACEIKYKTGQIILILHKADDKSWAPKLSQNGLEQDTS